MQLRNLVDKKILKAKLATDQTARKTVSFYRYVIIENPEELRDQLLPNGMSWAPWDGFTWQEKALTRK